MTSIFLEEQEILFSGLHLFLRFVLHQWMAVSTKYQFTKSPNGTNTLLPFSPLYAAQNSKQPSHEVYNEQGIL